MSRKNIVLVLKEQLAWLSNCVGKISVGLYPESFRTVIKETVACLWLNVYESQTIVYSVKTSIFAYENWSNLMSDTSLKLAKDLYSSRVELQIEGKVIVVF